VLEPEQTADIIRKVTPNIVTGLLKFFLTKLKQLKGRINMLWLWFC